VRTTTTDEQGRYRIVSVPAGRYTVRAELDGFQTVVREGITLTINMKANTNFTLKVAAVAETITVTGESPIVETSTSEVGLTFTTKTIEDLPLNGRNPTDLLLLAPGVAVGRARGGYAISGSLERNNSYTIDGIDNNDDIVGGRRVDLQQDVVREFQLITNQFTAEYGRASGGAVNDIRRKLRRADRSRQDALLLRLRGGDETENLEFDLAPTNYAAVGPYPAIQGGFRTQDRTTKEPKFFAKGTHQFNDRHTLALTFNYEKDTAPTGGCSGTDLTCFDFGGTFLFDTDRPFNAADLST
jgi:hypothetical protein